MNVFREPRVILTPECASCQYVYILRPARVAALFSHPLRSPAAPIDEEQQNWPG